MALIYLTEGYSSYWPQRRLFLLLASREGSEKVWRRSDEGPVISPEKVRRRSGEGSRLRSGEGPEKVITLIDLREGHHSY